MYKTYIKVKGQYEGFHKYEHAPDKVAFLRNNHRHMFYWTAVIGVNHDERELEFFLVKWEIEQAVAQMCGLKGGNLGSCESQARIIVDAIRKEWGERYIQVEVSEDNESSGTVIYSPSENYFFNRQTGVREVYDWATPR